jgi:hypothetical protein
MRFVVVFAVFGAADAVFGAADAADAVLARRFEPGVGPVLRGPTDFAALPGDFFSTF